MKTELRCIYSGVVEEGLRFINPQEKTLVQCFMKGTRCQIWGPKKDKYSYVFRLENKMIILTIHQFDKLDIGRWSCSDGLHGPHATCNVLLPRKFIYLIEIYDDYAAAADDDNSNITHNINNSNNNNV